MQPTGKFDSEFFSISSKQPNETMVRLHKSLNIDNAAHILKQLLRFIDASSPLSLTLDLSEVSQLDEYGALVLFEIKHKLENKSRLFKMINMSERSGRILALVHFDTHVKCSQTSKKKSGGLLVRLGEDSITQAYNLRFMISFIGSLVLSLVHVLAHPRALRINDTIVHIVFEPAQTDHFTRMMEILENNFAFPDTSNPTVMSKHTAVGSSLSSTVTIAVAIITFPLASVLVTFTVFAPTSEQSKLVWSIVITGTPQLSAVAAVTSVVAMLAFPLPSNWMVTSCVVNVGSIVSSTVTTATHVELFPASSVTVNVTLLTPTSVQSNVV